MKDVFSAPVLDQLFRDARSINVWKESEISDDQLQDIYDLLKMGPTSANCSPARFVFVRSEQAKERLKPYLMEGNVEKVMQAPVTAIIAYDLDFAQKLPELFPHNPDAVNWFTDPDMEYNTAFRNSTLQGAYFMMAARALGYDCGPMSGFDNSGVDAEFFAGTRIRSNFLCSIGVGSSEKIFPRSPRLAFGDAAQIL